jgi:hypothetical protein
MSFLAPGTVGRLMLEYQDLWQMRLIDPAELARFGKDRGLTLWDRHITKLWQLRLLRADLILTSRKLRWKDVLCVGIHRDGRYIYADERRPRRKKMGWANALKDVGDCPPWIELLFHPFRHYVLYELERIFQLCINPMQILLSDRYTALVERQIAVFSDWSASGDFLELIKRWNDTAGLAVLTEPCTFERIFRHSSRPAGITDEQWDTLSKQLCERVANSIEQIGLDQINEIHNGLCVSADLLDQNVSLHTIIRFGSRDLRLKSKGRLGGAIFIKTMAESIRRAAELFLNVEMLEEDDRGFGLLSPAIKEENFGSRRFLDGDRRVAERYLRHYMLDYSIRLRWYVEGDTEYGALTAVLETFPAGVEVINLRGRIVERGAIAFRDSLRADINAEIFSFVLLDADREDNIRVVRAAARGDEICGQFHISDPDFEFANFELSELEELIWEIAEANGVASESREQLHRILTSATSSTELEELARTALPELSQFSKGYEWGRQLMEYGWQHPRFPDDRKRPIIEAIETALRADRFDYRETRRRNRVDPDTGKLVNR